MKELTQVSKATRQMQQASAARDEAILLAHQRGATMRKIATAASLTPGRVHQIIHAAIPWTTDDEQRAAELRSLPEPTEAERAELAELRKREINESIRRRTS